MDSPELGMEKHANMVTGGTEGLVAGTSPIGWEYSQEWRGEDWLIRDDTFVGEESSGRVSFLQAVLFKKRVILVSF